MSGAGQRIVRWTASPGAALKGALRVPGDKSISHRAIILASIAQGRSEITGFLEGDDTRATAAALAAMGVRIDAPSAQTRVVHGVGLHGLSAPAAALDCGNSGTGMRLLAGLLAGQRFASTLIGDSSLSQRPMRRVIEPLRAMGAQIVARDDGFAPIEFKPSAGGLHGIDWRLQVASAQVKSCLLLAGLYASGTTRISEPTATRDHTERMLRAMGCPVRSFDDGLEVQAPLALDAQTLTVPADFSSAAFPLVAACLVPGSELVLEGVGVNPRRIGLLRVLERMGARIELVRPRRVGAEPVADLVVRHAPLHGIELPSEWVPDMIDEFPILFVAAAAARGNTVIRGVAELRVKESDRLAGMSAALRALGIRVDESADGAVIHGGTLKGGVVDALGDHRIAMAAVVAGQLAAAPVEIADCANVRTSFPGFLVLAQSIGMGLTDCSAATLRADEL